MLPLALLYSPSVHIHVVIMTLLSSEDTEESMLIEQQHLSRKKARLPLLFSFPLLLLPQFSSYLNSLQNFHSLVEHILHTNTERDTKHAKTRDGSRRRDGDGWRGGIRDSRRISSSSRRRERGDSTSQSDDDVLPALNHKTAKFKRRRRTEFFPEECSHSSTIRRRRR